MPILPKLQGAMKPFGFSPIFPEHQPSPRAPIAFAQEIDGQIAVSAVVAESLSAARSISGLISTFAALARTTIFGSAPLVLDFLNGSYRESGTSYALTALPGYAYTRTGQVSFVNASGTVTDFAANVAPVLSGIGYQAYGALTNGLTHSQTFDSFAVWSWNGTGSITADAAIAPDGTTTADTWVPDTSNNSHAISQATGLGTGTFTFSVFAKAAGYPRVGMRVYDGSAYQIYATFDLSNGTVVSAGAGSAYMIPCGNGWYRCVGIGTSPSGNMGGAVGWVLESNPAGHTVQQAFIGDGTSGAHFWQGQALAGSFPDGGPIIATTTAPASIGAEVLSVSLANGSYNATYSFSDGTTQTISKTISGGSVTLDTYPSVLNQPTVQSIIFSASSATIAIAINAAVAVGAAVSRGAAFARAAAGAVAIRSSQAQAAGHPRSISASIAAFGSIANVRAFVRGISAAIVTSASSARAAAYVRAVNGAAVIAGSIARASAFARGIAAAIWIKALIARPLSAPRSISGAVAIIGTSARVLQAPRSVTGVVALQGQVINGKAYIRQIAGSISTFGKLTVQKAYGRVISSSVAVTGSVGRVLSAARSVAGHIATAAAVTRTAALQRAVSGRVAVLAQVQSGRSYARTVAASVRASVALQTTKTKAVQISGLIALAPSLARQLAANRLISGAVAIGGSLGKGLSLSRSIAGSIAMSASTAVSTSYSRAISGLVGLRAAIIVGAPHVFEPFGPIIKFIHQRLPFPRAVREDRNRKF